MRPYAGAESCIPKRINNHSQYEQKKARKKQVEKKKVKTTVASQTDIAEGIYDMWIDTDLAESAQAGQFICIYPHDKSALLPRPISICETDIKSKRMRIVYRVAGKGTKEFAQYHTGRKIEILGNLGTGFPIEKAAGKRVLVMGGGIGIPPLVQLVKTLKETGEAREVTVAAGYRNNQLFLKEDLEQYAVFYAATEDGSAGTKGTVMDAIAEHGLTADVIYACGPMPMLSTIKRYAQENGIEAYISLEERMACGVGACLGCVCKTSKKDEHSHVNNARICTDGPVFLADDVEI